MANIPNKNTVFVILNGPSSARYTEAVFSGPTFGCNFAYRDFDLQYCCSVDLKAIRIIEGEAPGGIQLFSKRYPDIGVRWQKKTIPGIDSGSFALEQALIIYPNSIVYVIGADGILRQDNTTRYEYEWRNGRQPNSHTHQRHRQSMIGLINKYKKSRVVFVSDNQDPELETITHENFIRTSRVALDAKRPEYSEEGI